MAIRSVFFDVGETLVDETRDWGEWADFLGVSRLTFFAALGAVIARGHHHREVFRVVRPQCDFAALSRLRHAAGSHYAIEARDFYPDAIPCLAALKRRGLCVGIVGNQPSETERVLAELKVPADVVATSATWGVEKPSPGFFERIIAVTPGHAPNEIAYVGDRIDIDILPAARAGMVAILLERGPWAMIQPRPVGQCHFHTISSLAELPPLLDRLSPSA